MRCETFSLESSNSERFTWASVEPYYSGRDSWNTVGYAMYKRKRGYRRSSVEAWSRASRLKYFVNVKRDPAIPATLATHQ